MSASDTCLERPRRNIWSEAQTKAFAVAGTLFCRLFHKSISRPVHGKYRCWKCLREFDLEW